MIKKFIVAAVVSAIVLGGAADARETAFFGDFEMPQTDFSEIVYERGDMEGFERGISRAKELLDSAVTAESETELEGILSELDSRVLSAATMYVLSNINESKDNSPENNSEREIAFGICSDMEKEYRRLYEAAADTGYRELLIEIFGSEEALEEFLEDSHTDRYYSLTREEQDIISDYYENQFGTYVLIDEDGEELSIRDIYSSINSAFQDYRGGEEDASPQMFRRLGEKLSRYYSESNAVLAEIYKRLVNVRNEIAAEEGYDNYAEYAYDRIYCRDYSIEEAEALSGYIDKYISPVQKKAQEMIVYLSPSPLKGSDEENTGLLGDCINDISSEMYGAYRYMLDRHMYDADYSDKKIAPGSAFTTYLYSYSTPYLFMSPYEEDSDYRLNAMTHEFGHFNAMLYEPVYRSRDGGSALDDVNDSGMSIDLAEVNSQGLELLMTNYYRDFYGLNNYVNVFNSVSGILTSVVYAGRVNRFETEVYRRHDMSVEEMNELFGGQEWIEINHLFTSPLYYISYGTSALAAMNIWKDMDSGLTGAADKYLSFCSRGDYLPFKQTLEECGFDDIFSEEYSRELGNMFMDRFGLGYRDIDKSAWYYNSVFETQRYIDGVSSAEYGVDEPAARSMCAKGIAKVYGDNFRYSAEVFLDVPYEDSGYIGWAKENGIVQGYDDGVFGYYDSISREQAVVMLYRCAKETGLSGSFGDETSFTDEEQISSWAKDAVIWANNTGIINGYNDGSFRPRGNVTKAEFAQMLSRLMDIS